MSTPPGRRAARQPSEPTGPESSPPARPVGGRRASEPTTGTIPVIKAPLLGDEESQGSAGRRIRAAAPVSSAADADDRRVVRSFDHTGEIPAVQFTLPPRADNPDSPSERTGTYAAVRTGTHRAITPADLAQPAPRDAARGADGQQDSSVDLPPVWTPNTAPVPSTPVVPDAVELIAAAEQAADEQAGAEQADAAGDLRRARFAKQSSWSRRAQARAERKAREAGPLEALAEAAASASSDPADPSGPAGSGESGTDTDAQDAAPGSESAAVAETRAPRRGLRPRGRQGATPPATPPSEDLVPTASGDMRPGARKRLTFWSGVLAVGVVLLALAALHVGPGWLDGVGAVAVLTTYCWAVAGRTGGRQVVFSLLGLALGTAALLVDGAVLRSGVAMMTCVVSGVLGVVLTVPARNFLTAVREVVVAMAVASIGAFAVIGFEPVASTSRFEILALCLGMASMVALVWRFAAGLHGLGTRGLVIVVAGAVFLTASQLYTELLRTYGDSGMVQPTGDFSGWLRQTFGASPRTTMVFLGIPALVWGVHMRARRRQGWWVCVFGVAATLPVAQRLVNLETSYVEAGLQTFYSAALGCLIGWVLIRLDLRMTGTRGARARADEETAALRPEPSRFASL